MIKNSIISSMKHKTSRMVIINNTSVDKHGEKLEPSYIAGGM